MVKKEKKLAKKIKDVNFKSEEQQEITRFIKILILVVIFLLAIYFLTSVFVKKDYAKDNEETSVTEINYNKIVFGNMLNRPYDEYYVLAFSSLDNKANYYSALVESYKNAEKSLPIYYIDLEDSMNSEFISKDDNTNNKAESLNDLKVGSLTLIKIKDSKIVKYIEKVEEIKSELEVK